MGQLRKPCVVFPVLLAFIVFAVTGRSSGQDAVAPPAPPARTLPAVPATPPEDRPLPINLPTALQLANVRAVDIAAAAERIQVAAAVLEQAQRAVAADASPLAATTTATTAGIRTPRATSSTTATAA